MGDSLGPKTVRIVVTAENGKEQTYTIDLYREAKECPKYNKKPCNKMGECAPLTGKCDCVKNYGGSSCGIYCPNACSGHGTCGQKECTTDIAQENIPAAMKAELTAKYKIPGNSVSCSAAGSKGLCCEVLNGQLVKDLLRDVREQELPFNRDDNNKSDWLRLRL
jgi:hypothetical protein